MHLFIFIIYAILLFIFSICRFVVHVHHYFIIHIYYLYHYNIIRIHNLSLLHFSYSLFM
jgi:hypothetical protein